MRDKLNSLGDLLGIGPKSLRVGSQPRYVLPLDGATALPDLSNILGGFESEFILALSREEIATVLDRLIAYPLVCHACGLQAYWGTSWKDIDREENPNLGPFEYACCINCDLIYPVDEMPAGYGLLLKHSIPDLVAIQNDILRLLP